MAEHKAKTKKSYIIKLQETIDAIDTAREQQIEILKEALDLKEVNDEKLKAVSEGKATASKNAIAMLQQVKELEKELDELKNPKKEKTVTETKKKTTNPLDKRLKS